MTGRIHVRQPARPHRQGPRRASARMTPIRAIAALAILAVGGATWGVTASTAFGVRGVAIAGNHLTSEATIRAAIGLPSDDPGPNAFTLRTDAIRASLVALPAVANADVRVGLPGSLTVTITERVPILVWKTDGAALLVDADGVVVADAAAADATDAARSLAQSLPAVEDLRTTRWPLADDWRPAVRQAPRTGGVLQPLELAIARQLLSLKPADVGSGAPGLRVAIDDQDGWTMQPIAKDPWTAVFGFYSTTIRPPDLVAGQVRLLRSLLVAHPAGYPRIVLADDRNGTLTQRNSSASARPSSRSSAATLRPSLRPSATPRPSTRPSARPSPRASAAP